MAKRTKKRTTRKETISTNTPVIKDGSLDSRWILMFVLVFVLGQLVEIAGSDLDNITDLTRMGFILSLSAFVVLLLFVFQVVNKK